MKRLLMILAVASTCAAVGAALPHRCEPWAEGAGVAEGGDETGSDHQGDLGQRTRSGPGQLDQAWPPVRRDQPEGRDRRVHGNQGDDLGRRPC